MDGGGMGSRTPDLLNAIQTLYQLSYTPKVDERMIAKFDGQCQTKRQLFALFSTRVFMSCGILKECREKSQFASGAFAP